MPAQDERGTADERGPEGGATPPALDDETVRSDPSQLIRACAIAGRLKGDVRDVLLEGVGDHASLATGAEPSRLAAALTALLLDDDPSDGLWAMIDSGLADVLIPELTALHLEQDPIHTPHKDILAHTVQVTAQTPADLRLRLAALFHDAGKPRSRRYEGGAVTFHHHEAIGARLARRRLSRLGFEDDVVRDVDGLIALSGRFHGYSTEWTDSAVRRYARDAGPLLDRLNQLVRSDCTTKSPRRRRALDRAVDHLEMRLAEVARRDDEASRRPVLDGRQIMEHLGIGPGPEVGAARRHLIERAEELGPLTEQDARRLLDDWWAERQGGQP